MNKQKAPRECFFSTYNLYVSHDEYAICLDKYSRA